MWSLKLLTFISHVAIAVAVTPSNAKTSLTLLYQNNLNATDDVNHVGFILLDAVAQKDASAACKAIGETLISKATIQAHATDFIQSLSYVAYSGRASNRQSYYIQNGVTAVVKSAGILSFSAVSSSKESLPVLCTQSSNQAQPDTAVATASNKVAVSSSGNTYVGYRNQKSFRFLGVPYADPAARFVYSSQYSKKGQTINTTAYGSQCPQWSGGSEDCLFLNIQTPYIPKQGSTKFLKPVLFWIHGGGFVNGNGADPLTDGGNLASREDVVVITINYRLSTLGFLAIPGTKVTGNYGIADQITALEWTIKNIAAFGGDPKQITINGDSAGAGAVRTLLGSPPAKGKFQGAMSMSNLGGGVGLGLSSDYGTTYSSYLTVPESYAIAGQNIFTLAGCTQTLLDAQIACLKQVPALTIINLAQSAHFVVQDGHYVNTEELDLVNGTAAHVPVIFGVTADEGAAFSTYPKIPVANESAGIQAALGISALWAQKIIDSGLFPYQDTGNVTFDSFNVSQRIATDIQFRCVDQATVYAAAKTGAFPAAYYYQMDRTIAGYDPNNLGGAPVTPGYPNGNPNLPYFRYHSADMPWIFGNIAPLRDAADLYSVQQSVAYFAEFFKTGQPNPPQQYLSVRGYTTALKAIQKTGPWEAVKGKQGPIRRIDWPSVASTFVDVPQCDFLNYPLSYYVDGGV